MARRPLSRTIGTLVELFYPSNCVVCGAPQPPGELLCNSCRGTLLPIKAPFCQTCSRPFEGVIDGPFDCPNCEDWQPAFRCAVSAYLARGTMRELVHRFKYNGHFYLRSLLAEFLMEAVNDDRIQAIPIDAFVPVPLHPTRRRERGFNQAEALAQVLSRNVQVPVCNILARRVYTSTQTRFDRIDRMENLRNAFSLSENRPMRGKHLVLVDDVLTTGATLHNCAKTLLVNGAESVRAITLARG